MSSLSVNHLLGIKYLNLNDLKLIFETSDHFKEVINRKIKKVPSIEPFGEFYNYRNTLKV